MSMQKRRDSLTGRTVLVTGGAVRIGAVICRALAREGADVIIHYRRSRASAEALQREIQKLGRRAFLICAALDTEAACKNLMAQAVRRAGRVDILINNAAVFHKDALDSISWRKLTREFRTNLFAPLVLIREFARVARRGVIINLLDRRIAGWDARCLPYILTKKALAEATRAVARALAPRIRVNAVAPGPVLPPLGKNRAYLRDKAGPIPLKIELTPDDVADAVIFLARARAVTGQILFVDGGQGLLDDASFG